MPTGWRVDQNREGCDSRVHQEWDKCDKNIKHEKNRQRLPTLNCFWHIVSLQIFVSDNFALLHGCLTDQHVTQPVCGLQAGVAHRPVVLHICDSVPI